MQESLAVISGLNSDAPLGCKISFVTGGTGWVGGLVARIQGAFLTLHAVSSFLSTFIRGTYRVDAWLEMAEGSTAASSLTTRLQHAAERSLAALCMHVLMP